MRLSLSVRSASQAWAALLRRHFPSQEPAALDHYVRSFYAAHPVWRGIPRLLLGKDAGATGGMVWRRCG